jgi:hypothetical protein
MTKLIKLGTRSMTVKVNRSFVLEACDYVTAMVLLFIRCGTLDKISLQLEKRDWKSLSLLRSKIARKLSLTEAADDLVLECELDSESFIIRDGARTVGPLCPLRLAEHDSQMKNWAASKSE